MKKTGNNFFPTIGNMDKNNDLMKIAGIPPIKQPSDDLISSVAKKLAGANVKPTPVTPSDEDYYWNIHKRFIELYESHGKLFARFIGDFLDILMSGPMQEKLVSELIDEAVAQKKRKISQSLTEEDLKVSSVPPAGSIENEVKIGGEPRVRLHHFLKRKKLFASIFVDPKEHTACQKIIKNINLLSKQELDFQNLESLPPEKRKENLRETVFRLKREITRLDLLHAWYFLEKAGFNDLELIFTETRDLGLLRPSYYEDLDKAYRDGKRLIKLLLADFEKQFPPLPEKREGIASYLNEILEIYTYHHFVVKSTNLAKPTLSKKEMLEREETFQDKIEELKTENDRLREEKKRLQLDKDAEISEKNSLKRENDELKNQLSRLEPAEVNRQLRTMEAKTNQAQREYQEVLDENNELRNYMRKLDTESQQYLQQLRDLHAIPDESYKSVKDLLVGKRVVIFGGVGRDHYWALLKEAGVKDCDYEWYDGYRTISQARTAEIVRRCDVVVVITAYAGHLHTWQTRSTVTDQQDLYFIHNSGTGTLRQQILEKYKK
ncbi:MAG: hypothetical protein HQM08_17840 [Candidatus Riflebacteria bacterium]|nr:hypothetical protein [Candidatus Riflebacteria bacterium]